jgi:non-specific serine/threonine protein kinase
MQDQLEAANAALSNALLTASGDQWGQLQARFGLALVLQAKGAFAEAADILRTDLALCREVGGPIVFASAQGQLGLVNWARHEYDSGYIFMREGLQGFYRARNQWGLALCVAGLTRAAALHGDWAAVVRLTAAAEALRVKVGAAEYATVAWAPMALVQSARQHVAPDLFEAEWHTGSHMSVEAIVDMALAIPAPPRIQLASTDATFAGTKVRPCIALTRREREVALLAARGLSNRSIGAQLVIAERTVETHLEHVFAKLDIRSRVQLAGALEDWTQTARPGDSPGVARRVH